MMGDADKPIIERVRKLYKPPFRYDAMGGYIWDNDGNMVADEAGKAMRLRGWGRIGYMEDAEVLHDAVGELLAKVLTDGWETDVAELRAEIARLRAELTTKVCGACRKTKKEWVSCKCGSSLCREEDWRTCTVCNPDAEYAGEKLPEYDMASLQTPAAWPEHCPVCKYQVDDIIRMDIVGPYVNCFRCEHHVRPAIQPANGIVKP